MLVEGVWGGLVLHKAIEMLVPTRGEGWRQRGSVHFSSRAGLCEAEAKLKIHLMIRDVEASDIILLK